MSVLNLVLNMSKYSSVVLICSVLVVLVQSEPEGRIVGGSSAIKGQFPYQVSLQLNGQHSCGGSIISKNYILTAAHCVFGESKKAGKLPFSNITILAGTVHLDEGVKIPVAEIIEHPRYIHEGNSADIALVRLAETLTFSKTIQPIKLSSDNISEDTSVIISGWGSLWEGGFLPNHLRWTVLKSFSDEMCSLTTGRSPDKILCLGELRFTGFCRGDSGGPAVVDNRLVGVGSFNKGLCGIHQPDCYVKISGYFDWIKKNSDVSD